MINNDTKIAIRGMFLGGSGVREVLVLFPQVGRTTVYALKKEAYNLAKTRIVSPTELCEIGPVGVIGDTHLPFEHPRYLEFVEDTFAMYGVTTIVHIGDFWDNHAMSFHEADPEGQSAADEFKAAEYKAQEWYETFPDVFWMSGNHDNIPKRRIKAAGLTKRILRKNIYGTPDGWKNSENLILNDVRYSHGIGSAGVMGHLNLSKAKGMSVVMGHCHSFGGVNYRSNERDMFFGMNVGCGLDIDSYAMEYGKDFPQRPTLGCGIVQSSTKATFVPMDMRRYSRHVK